MDLFLTNALLFTSQILTDGLELCGFLWIIVMYLSAVWTLILKAPIHCIGSTGEQIL